MPLFIRRLNEKLVPLVKFYRMSTFHNNPNQLYIFYLTFLVESLLGSGQFTCQDISFVPKLPSAATAPALFLNNDIFLFLVEFNLSPKTYIIFSKPLTEPSGSLILTITYMITLTCYIISSNLVICFALISNKTTLSLINSTTKNLYFKKLGFK